ncbi:hypothetical protein ABEV34_04890 [Methylorubrum rhodesianum]|uniref:hypothetical protein n=1 Tax=Methylorubrum TaxID=2282523 RepID=UPI001E34EEC3|nr:hypothetical protein [Methylorubrum sp. B1-46]UGB28674.1 hypothetical protein LPC10_25485 [Methylorubrum sp. B1-46]
MIFAGVSGLTTLARELSDISKAVRIATAAKSRSIAGEMVEGMRARVSVVSGALRDSIRAEENEDGTVTVRAGGTPETARPTKAGTVYDTALIEEYGTIHEPAEPFFWPEVEAAKERHGPEVIQAAEDATGES